MKTNHAFPSTVPGVFRRAAASALSCGTGLVSLTYLLSFLFVSDSLYAQSPRWVPMNGPYGGTVSAVMRARDGSLLAGTELGVYRSADGGATWIRSAEKVTVQQNDVLLSDTSGRLFAGTNGVWRSTDHGSKWAQVAMTNQNVSALAVDRGNTLFAAVQGPTMKGVYRSTDGGVTWSAYGLSTLSVTTLLSSTRYGLLAIGSSSLYRRQVTDTGWVKVSSTSANALAEDSSGVLYVGRELAGVYRSTDGGVSWSATTLKSPYTVVGLTSLGSGQIYAAVTPLDPSIEGGVYRSTDQGVTWTSLGLTQWSIKSVLALDSSRVFLGSYRGVFRTVNGGQDWETACTGIIGASAKSLLYVDTSTVLAGTSCGLFRSTDNGESWLEDRQLPPWGVSLLEKDKWGNHFAGTMVFTPGGGIYKSTDKGLTWRCTTRDSLKGNYIYVNAMVFTQSSMLIAAVSGIPYTILRSSDRGESWIPVRGYRSNRAFNQLAADSGSAIYAATWGSGLARSTDEGVTWDTTNIGLPNLNLYTVVTRDSMEVFAGGIGGVSRSTNGGDLWNCISTPLGNIITKALVVLDKKTLLMSTTTGSVYRTTNNGVTWLPDSLAGTINGFQSFARSGPVLAAVDTMAFYRYTGRLTGVDGTPAAIPGSYILTQNYPNPFNPVTTVAFELPSSSHVTLVVHDLLGREITVLVNEVKSAGHHTVTFDARGLASGVYFYSMSAGGHRQARKMIILR